MSDFSDLRYSYDPTPDPPPPEAGVGEGWILWRDPKTGVAMGARCANIADGDGSGTIVQTGLPEQVPEEWLPQLP